MKFKKSDPLKWSVFARRVFGVVTVLISLGSFLLLYLNIEWLEARRDIARWLVIIPLLPLSSLFWVAAAHKYGYRDAFIMVLLYYIAPFLVIVGFRWMGWF